MQQTSPAVRDYASYGLDIESNRKQKPRTKLIVQKVTWPLQKQQLHEYINTICDFDEDCRVVANDALQREVSAIQYYNENKFALFSAFMVIKDKINRKLEDFYMTDNEYYALYSGPCSTDSESYRPYSFYLKKRVITPK